jgi:hypothetical protein
MPDLQHTVVYNVVAGAVRNVLHGHPDWVVPKSFARSVAKRAAGTLAGMSPGVALAAARRSGQRVRVRKFASGLPLADCGSAKGAAHVSMMDARLLKLCQAAIERRIAAAKKAGDHARYIALCAAARALKQELEREGRGHE